ncbi:hypothetical protein F5887DRAFT_967433 [Amanita rubescens]|nr:hypothetical protein F5887DRAFT_967433 [Amanita rubescens]
MLAGSWALVRLQWFKPARSARAAGARTFSSANYGTVYPSKLHIAHYSRTETEQTVDGALPQATANENGQAKSENVFEDYAEEYVSIASASQPPKPSVMDVITNTLPAMLPQPSTDDMSIFEEESSEYETHVATTVSKITSIDRHLWKLLRAGQHDEAYDILVEVKQLGSEPRFNLVYEAAAIATLDSLLESSSTRAVAEQLTRFETFFSYIPPSWSADKVRSFSEIRKRILHAPLINMDLIIRFSLILFRKGYQNLVQKYTIPIIARFASSEVCLQFLRDTKAANKQLYSSQFNKTMRRATARQFRATSLYWLAFSGRLEEALTLLPRKGLREKKFKLKWTVHALLRFHLERSSDPAHHELIPYVDSLLEDPPAGQPLAHSVPRDIGHNDESLPELAEPGTSDQEAYGESGETQAFAELEDQAIVDMDLDLPSPSPVGIMAVTLRRLKNAYASSTEHLFTKPPPLEEVLSFFTSYMTYLPDENGRAIRLLRRRAFRLGRGPASHFLFAEMLYYYRTGMPGLVLETYVKHFYISALPKENVLELYREFRDCRRNEYGSTEEVSWNPNPMRLSFRMGMSEQDILLLKTQLWPTTGHTTLVWHALVALTAGDNIQQLYQKLLQIATEGSSFMSSPSSQFEKCSTALVPPSTWRSKVPAAAYTPFFRKMLKTSGEASVASLGASLLNDMVRAGTAPNKHHLTEVARSFAQEGDSRRAFMIMEQMEAAKKEREEHSGYDPESGDKPTLFPIPDSVFYRALLRGFISNGNLDDAERVAAKIPQLDEPAPGTEETSGQNEVIDRLRQDLAELRRAKGYF